MAEPVLINPWIPIIAALSGVVIAQAFSILLSILDKRHKKHVLLRQKYEEMMFEFQNSLSYVQDVHTRKTLDQLSQLSSSPHSGKAYSLALLYFPNLVKPLNGYIAAQISFYTSVITIFDENIPTSAGGQAIMIEGHKQARENLFRKKEFVMDALISNAKKYIKA